MKILFLTDNFPPEVNAPASRTYEHCKIWVENGAEVTVITCAPNFPQGKVYSGYKNSWIQSENVDGIKVIRVWSYITANKGFLKRTLDFFSFAVSAFWAGMTIKTDVIIATSPQFFTALAGNWLSFVKRKPWVMEVRDLWPESIIAVGAMKNNSVIYRMLEALELRMYRSAEKIVTVTDAFKKNITDRGIHAGKIEVVKNGVDPKLFSYQPKNEILQEKLGLKGKFIVGYIGTHGMAHNLDFILNGASKITNHKIHFLFVGDGAEKKNLLLQKEKLGLQNCTFLDPVPKNEIKQYISITDLALVPLKKSDTFKTVIPSKIFENAAMAKPIFLGVEGESKAIVEQYNAGLCFEPENESDFLYKLNLLFSQPDLYEKLQAGCFKLARAFDRKTLAENMLGIIKSCADPGMVNQEEIA